MDMIQIYKYAYWGAIEHLKTITKLYNVCIDSVDYNTAEEYNIKLQKAISDFEFIVSILGYDIESCRQILDYELRKVV